MWAQIINALLGLWLMVSPAVLDTNKTTADNAHIVGPLIASFAIISWWESTRVVRLYNVPCGLWLLVAPWVLGYDSGTTIFNDMAVGAVVVALAFVKGKVEEKFGGGWSAIWGNDPLHSRQVRNQPKGQSPLT